MASGNREKVLDDAKSLVELFTRLHETLTKASSKNESLLEAIESSQARASENNSAEASLLRNLRARLAAVHAPNSELRRDLSTFTGLFEKRYKELDNCIASYQELLKVQEREHHDLETRIKCYEKERIDFEKERSLWKEELEQARQEIIEQNDRLTVLSEQLAGRKVELDAKRNELASQRIAFEEEKLARLSSEGQATNSEAEALRLKLKEQVLRNVELENALLRAELSLHQKEESIMELEGKNQRLQRDIVQNRTTSSRAIKQFERRTNDANKKLAQMNSELARAQEHARRFQDLLTAERRRQKGLKHALEQELQQKATSGDGDVLTPAAQKAYISTLSETLASPSKPHTPMRVEDVIRKSEAILIENAKLKAEIRRLRIDNSDLIKRLRFADNNAHYMRNQVVSNVADRAELIKRLDKAEMQYRELEQSLTKQATDWVAQKKKEGKVDKSLRWSQIEPIPVLGATERTWNVPTAKTQNQSLSRSVQVHKW